MPASADFTSSPAVGVTATVDGRVVRVGGPRLLAEAGQRELDVAAAWHADGAIVLHVLVDGTVAGALALADEIRDESRQAVDALRRQGIGVVMITGDAEPVARSVAARARHRPRVRRGAAGGQGRPGRGPAGRGPHGGHGG